MIMNNLSAHIALFGCNLFWALSYPFYKIAMPTYIEPLPLLTMVLMVAALISIISMLFDLAKGRANSHIDGGDMLKVVIAGLLIALIRKGLLVFGLSNTSPIDGSIIFTISPIVVLIISVIVGIERFSMRKTLGMVLGLGGAIGVILTSDDKSSDGAGMMGNIMVLGCAFITAIYMVWFKRLLQKYDPIVLLRWMFIVAAIVLTPIGLDSVTKVDFSAFTPHAWVAVLYLITIPTFLPNILLTSALKRVAPSTASIYAYIQPTVAVIISIALGLDKLHATTVIFAVLIFVGVGLVIKRSGASNQI